jgi:hypothetical protein
VEGEGNGNEIPENIQGLLDDIPLVDADTPEEELIYSRAKDGNCMTCQAALGEDTMIVIASTGIIYAACGGACLTDMQVIGWLEEQHQDIVDKVKFRGGEGDAPSSDTDEEQ